jgi:hypothetical protein
MEVGTPGFMSQAMSGQMPTYQYPAYGGMPQDVFDWTAPRVSNGQLIQPTRQAPAQFEAPIYTAPQPVYGGTPSYGTPPYGTPSTGGGMSAPTPIPPTTTPSILDPVITTAPYTGGRTPVVREKTPYVQQADPNAAVRDQITGLYGEILNRAPDPTGLDYWTVMAKQGMSMDDIRRNIEAGAEAQAKKGIGSLTTDQGTTAPVAETAPVVAPVAPVIAPPVPRQYFQTTNYESGEGYMVDLPTPMAGFEADASGGSWYNSSDSSGAVGANAGAEAAAAAADAAASAANNDGPGDGVGSAGNDAGAAGQGAGTGAEGQGTE